MHDAKVQFQKVTAAYERLTSEGDLPDEDSDDEDGYGWDFDEDAYYQAEDHFCNIWYASAYDKQIAFSKTRHWNCFAAFLLRLPIDLLKFCRVFKKLLTDDDLPFPFA